MGCPRVRCWSRRQHRSNRSLNHVEGLTSHRYIYAPGAVRAARIGGGVVAVIRSWAEARRPESAAARAMSSALAGRRPEVGNKRGGSAEQQAGRRRMPESAALRCVPPTERWGRRAAAPVLERERRRRASGISDGCVFEWRSDNGAVARVTYLNAAQRRKCHRNWRRTNRGRTQPKPSSTNSAAGNILADGTDDGGIRMCVKWIAEVDLFVAGTRGTGTARLRANAAKKQTAYFQVPKVTAPRSSPISPAPVMSDVAGIGACAAGSRSRC